MVSSLSTHLVCVPDCCVHHCAQALAMRRLLAHCFQCSCLCWGQRQAESPQASHCYFRAQEGQRLLVQAAGAGKLGWWGSSAQGVPQQVLPGTLLLLLCLFCEVGLQSQSIWGQDSTANLPQSQQGCASTQGASLKHSVAHPTSAFVLPCAAGAAAGRLPSTV